MAQVLSVHAHKNTTYTEICIYYCFEPKDCGPARSTGRIKCSSARCKLVMYVYNLYAKENSTFAFLELLILDYYNQCGC